MGYIEYDNLGLKNLNIKLKKIRLFPFIRYTVSISIKDCRIDFMLLRLLFDKCQIIDTITQKKPSLKTGFLPA